ncbi:tryptophan 7-halogenase [Nocardioides rotundus]|uniref:NAD(P)/FAD-dependent oxidoreductase n=1 Tax=Nocardioides rotundus TaxID=1774216 RepID=UPI001CC06ABF|nr:tryptophan 7-halogenase [Nocardioides rotundus]UAL31474.1 tryptophan 7-halogenase [Nocardioides rotundus]
MSAVSDATAPTADDVKEEVSTSVTIMGAGLVGMVNAMAYAKRGISVTLIDASGPGEHERYKVGESLLVYSNAFLRALGDVDEELCRSRPKGGFWMARGMEGRHAFDDDVCEWGFQSRLPQRWLDAIEDQWFVRIMFGDMQIARPEIENGLRRNVADHPLIRVVHGKVSDVQVADDGDHLVHWRSTDGEGVACSRWVIDCSGRSRLLARRLGTDTTPERAFRTSAAWAQFDGCTEDLFDDRWVFTFPDGEQIRRDEDTVHLWGEGYWIWIIKLSQDRVSVGVSWNRDRVWSDLTAREVFWEALSRYPVLDWLSPANELQFSAYKDVQRYTDTFVSERRFAIVGDASTMVDAYYSQGISLSLQLSWHVCNLVAHDLATGQLDETYLRRIDEAAQADWRLVASMVKGKYGPALADSRFFTFDHLLDYMIFGAALLGRYRISRWLAETGGATDAETPEYASLREGLKRRLFLSQSMPWNMLAPHRVADLVERWRDVLEANALWRLEHGVHLAPTKTGLRAQAALPGVWRLPKAASRPVDLTLPEIPEPGFMRVKGTEKRPLMLAGSGYMLLIFNTAALAYDVADTSARRLRRRAARMLPSNARRPSSAFHQARSATPRKEPTSVPELELGKLVGS